MDFLSRMTRSPQPYDPLQGAEVRAVFDGLSDPLADLVEGAGGSSPFLHGLMLRDSSWLSAAFNDPEAALEDVFQDVQDAPLAGIGDVLRGAKRRVALLTGLADLAGVWPLEVVTGYLTDFADLACQRALSEAIEREVRRGKLPGKGDEDIATACGMVVLAMGKMGAGELNYSSDIDLICLFDDTQFNPDDLHEVRASFVRATRRMSAHLNDRTAEGYVFRTDLRLRPDPSVTPVCMSMAAAETYYESLGRTWERAAYIKARPCAGDIAAGKKFLKTLKPFVWRRHLDFAAIEDAHNMRLRIRSAKGFGKAMNLYGHNMKLGRGGIREIEFFTQTRQIISGGRDASLRVRGTLEGLQVLAATGWIEPLVTERLSENYRFHREVEHRLQILRDAQTHDLPTTDEEFDRLAAIMGRDIGGLRSELLERLNEVDSIIDGFFTPEEVDAVPEQVGIELDGDILKRWTSYPALRSTRAVEIFNRLRPTILTRLASAPQPQEALFAFDAFLAGLPAGVQLLSLFEANPQLIDLLLDIAGTAPALANHLSRNASVFDAVIAGDFFAPWPGITSLRNELSGLLDEEADYEGKLNAVRRWRREWHFRVGVHYLRGLNDADAAGVQYSALAEATIAALYPQVEAHFATRHGPPPGRGAIVLAMGSLGAGRLNAGSDLDLIMIYDDQGVETSEGKRPLATRTYYARLTQAMITAVTAQTSEGRLYEVDMRLRPSGNQGPVATAWSAFQSYQQEEAWIWEHLALTRARPVAGEPGLQDDVVAFRAKLLMRPYSVAKVLDEVSEMRSRISAAKPPGGPLDPKLGGGRLQDIELLAQAATLLAGSGAGNTPHSLQDGVDNGWYDDADRRALEKSFRLCWTVTMASRLLNDAVPKVEGISGSAATFLLRETGAETLDELVQAMEQCSDAAEHVISAALKRAPTGGSM